MAENQNQQVQSPPRIFWRVAASSLLLWLAFPPIGLWFLGWVALIPLFDVVMMPDSLGKYAHRKIWLAGLVYWLATFYFIPIPHPALWAGWVVISIYLACYFPFFVCAARGLHQRLRLPYVIAIPVCWTGLEFARCHLLTGMGLVCLSHSQYEYPQVIQVADLFGAYTLTFIMTTLAVAVWQIRLFATGQTTTALLHLVGCVSLATGVLLYGNTKLNEKNEVRFEGLQVGLIQGSVDTVFPSTSEEAEKFYQDKTRHYYELYKSAIANWDEVDVVVWPENGWPVPDLHPETDLKMMEPQQRKNYEENAFYAWSGLLVRNRSMPDIIAGALTYEPLKHDSYASVLWIDESGDVADRYYKNHLVMFGEYVPLADWFPLLRRIPAIGKGLVAGTQSTTFEIDGVTLAPNICFESTVPHYIRSQVLELKDQDKDPDALVNLTNDGWFYGTSCLDFHLACNVFRAVEMRRPMLVCANTGFSAHIDQYGKIIQQGPRRQAQAILADVSATRMQSPYLTIGDWIPFVFSIIALVGFGIAFLKNESTPPTSGGTDTPDSN